MIVACLFDFFLCHCINLKKSICTNNVLMIVQRRDLIT